MFVFQPAECMEKIITLKRNEEEVELKRKLVGNVKMDASTIESVKALKGEKLAYKQWNLVISYFEVMSSLLIKSRQQGNFHGYKTMFPGYSKPNLT